jgi:hypothetical protein
MKHEDPDGLTQDEEAAFRSLAREQEPPPELEERIVNTLKDRAVIDSGPASAHAGPALRPAWALAASLVVFLLGLGTGRLTAPGTESGSSVRGERQGETAMSTPAQTPEAVPSTVLLMYTTAGYRPAATDDASMDRVREYAAWARGIRETGVGITGEKLADGGHVLRQHDGETLTGAPGSENGRVLAGYFIVQTQNEAVVEEIARSCPQLKYGGDVEVRPILVF